MYVRESATYLERCVSCVRACVCVCVCVSARARARIRGESSKGRISTYGFPLRRWRICRGDFYRIYPLTSFPHPRPLFLSLSLFILLLSFALFLFSPSLAASLPSSRGATSIEMLFPFRCTPVGEEARFRRKRVTDRKSVV